MHAAAVAATEEINLAGFERQQQASSFGQWLARYGSQALKCVHLGMQAGRLWQQPRLGLALPSGLQQLQSLTLNDVELPAAPDICAHLKLTRLSLVSCAVRPCSDVFAWVARQLVHLTGLQSLQLFWLNEQDTDPSEAGILALEEALGQLQQLTCLRLGSVHPIGAALAAASSLCQLQDLQLDFIGTFEQPLQMQWLPSSLTSLSLSECTVSCAAACSSGSSSSSSSSWKLPVLEQLELTEGVGGCEPALLLLMPQLHVFSYTPVEVFEADHEWPPVDREQQLVEVLPQLQHLQDLQLEYLVHWPSPSSCASLTASSQMTALVLTECRLPAGAAQHMFAAGQQLQQLQHLEVIAAMDTRENERHQYNPDLQITIEHNSALLRPDSLKLGPGDLSKLASCCPRLRDLSLIWCDVPGPGRGEAALEAAPLLQLTALTSLEVAGQYWNDQAAEKVLKHMTGVLYSSHIHVVSCSNQPLPFRRTMIACMHARSGRLLLVPMLACCIWLSAPPQLCARQIATPGSLACFHSYCACYWFPAAGAAPVVLRAGTH
jgi:hypothetical protein